MATLQERIETATARMETDEGLLHGIIHGGPAETVETDGGPVPTVAKQVADLNAAYAAAGAVSACAAERAAAEAAAGSAADAAAAAADEAATATAAELSASFATALASAQASQVAAQGSASSASVAAAAAAGSAVGAAASAAAAAASAIAAANATLADPLILASALPCLDLHAVPDVVPPVVIATRASTGLRTSVKGLLESVAINGLRTDCDPISGGNRGWLVEGARTNLLTYSEQFDNAEWGKVRTTVTTNSAVSPDGTTSAEMLTGLGGGVYYAVRSLTLADNTVYAFSAFVKQGTAASATLRVVDKAGMVEYVTITFATGAVTSSGSVIGRGADPVGDGWYRLWISVDSASGAISPQVFLWGPSDTSTLYWWGAQAELGAFPSSYIPTTTAAGTRSADLISVPLVAVPGFNVAEGGLFAEAEFAYPTFSGATEQLVGLDAGTSSNRLMVWKHGSLNALYLTINKAGVQLVSANLGAPPVGRFRVAVSWSAADWAVAINGVLAAHSPVSGAVPPGLANLRVGNRLSSVEIMFGHIRRVALFPRAVSATELALITGGL